MAHGAGAGAPHRRRCRLASGAGPPRQSAEAVRSDDGSPRPLAWLTRVGTPADRIRALRRLWWRAHGDDALARQIYSCLAYHKRGTVICGNNLALPVDRVDDAVLSAIGDDVLRPAVVQAVIDGVLDAFAPAAVSEQLEELRTEAAALDRELARLTDAIARGGNLDTLLAALQTRQARRGELATMMAVGEAVDVERFDRKAIEARVRDRVKGWRELLTKRVEDGRRLLREALASPLRFTPEGRSYRFEGEASFGAILGGIAPCTTFDSWPSTEWGEAAVAGFGTASDARIASLRFPKTVGEPTPVQTGLRPEMRPRTRLRLLRSARFPAELHGPLSWRCSVQRQSQREVASVR
jgi:hypothetical protein